jgi:Flp pilus assembly protein TadG
VGRGRRRSGKHGQAMVEFAMVLPLLLSIIFIIISVSFIWAVRIAAHKAAFDAAKHAAKQAQSGTPLDPSEAQRALDYDYNGSWVLTSFAEPLTIKSLGEGPDSDGSGYYKPEAVTLTIRYRIRNIPAWDVLNSLYGNSNNGLSDLTETAVAARVVNKY